MPGELPVKLILCIGLLVASPAFAQAEFPIVDVDANCKAWAPVPQAINICIREEQRAYDAFKLYWQRMSEDSRTELLAKIGSSSGPSKRSAGFYRILAQIADGLLFSQFQKEQDAAPAPRFRP